MNSARKRAKKKSKLFPVPHYGDKKGYGEKKTEKEKGQVSFLQPDEELRRTEST